MRRLFALLLALCCLSALLTPVLATTADTAGDTASADNAAGEGDAAGDGAAAGEDTDAAGEPPGGAPEGEDAETEPETAPAQDVLSETAYKSVTVSCTVDEKGRAYVSQTLELSIVGTLQEISFTFPESAKSPKVEGYKTKSETKNGVRVLTVSNEAGFSGVVTFQLSYNQSGLVTAGEASQILTLPLLSPQAYPIAALSFAVTLPAEFASSPSFSSGYYQDVIEDLMTVTSSGGVVTGLTSTPLQDNDTLTMSLTLPEGYFSGSFGSSMTRISISSISIEQTIYSWL